MLLLLIFLFAVQLVFLFLFWRLPKPVRAIPEEELPYVSVLICAKNEAQNLQVHLPLLLNQNYPSERWELVVVNDASDDTTAAVLDEFKMQHKCLKIISIDHNVVRQFPGKKHALIYGLRHCQHEAVLLTDADCRPGGTEWINKMACAYKLKKQTCPASVLVLGYGAYEERPGLLNAFIRWETLHTFMQYASFAMKGLPYMGVGRNLMYEKTAVLNLIEDDQLFKAAFAKTPSGDDDLIVSKLAQKHNVAVVADAEAKTISKAPETWSLWFRQKTRHVSTGKYYQRKIKMMLGVYAFSMFMFWVLFISIVIGTFSNDTVMLAITVVLVRSLIFVLVESRWRDRLKEPRNFWLLGDVAWTVYNVFLSPYIFWRNKQQWK